MWSTYDPIPAAEYEQKTMESDPQTIEMINAAMIDATGADSIPNGFAACPPAARAWVDDQ